MYERLTTRLANGGVGYDNGEYFMVCYPWNEHCLTDIDRMAIKLCDLEDKIEQGKILELPCKVGDTIWEVWSSGSDFTQIQRGVRAIKVDLIYINQYDTIFHCISEEMTGHIPLSDFGKTVFLTPEEANKKMKELEL